MTCLGELPCHASVPSLDALARCLAVPSLGPLQSLGALLYLLVVLCLGALP
jgi:hypothetical protein